MGILILLFVILAIAYLFATILISLVMMSLYKVDMFSNIKVGEKTQLLKALDQSGINISVRIHKVYNILIGALFIPVLLFSYVVLTYGEIFVNDAAALGFALAISLVIIFTIDFVFFKTLPKILIKLRNQMLNRVEKLEDLDVSVYPIYLKSDLGFSKENRAVMAIVLSYMIFTAVLFKNSYYLIIIFSIIFLFTTLVALIRYFVKKVVLGLR